MKHTLLCATALTLLCSGADAAVLVNRQNTPVSFIVEVNNVQQFITLAPGETYDTHSNTGTVTVGSQKPFTLNGSSNLMISNGVVSAVPANVAVGGQVVNPQQPVSQPILTPNSPPSTVNPPTTGGNLQNPLAPPDTANPNPPEYNANGALVGGGGVTTGATTIGGTATTPVTTPPANFVPTQPTAPITGAPLTPQPLKK